MKESRPVNILMNTVLVLDDAQLRNVTLNDEPLMREMICMPVSHATERIEYIGRGVEDAPTCRRFAHDLVGVCGNLGAMSMAALCRIVERDAVETSSSATCRSTV